MKKPAFIITQTILSIFLAASVGAVGALVYDLKTDSLHIDKFNPFAASDSSKKNEPKKVQETSKQESSQKSEVQESSVQESSTVETIKLREEPADLQSQPQELIDMLKRYGYKIDYNVSGDHLIVVDTSKSTAKIYLYQKSKSGYWWNVIGDNEPITEKGYIGEKGSSFVISEGSEQTPGGIWWMGKAFYTDDKPNSTYSMFQITEDTYWVTDSNSKFYNQRVEGTEEKDWTSAEHMITMSKQYKYGIVINYNTSPAKAGAGSAIFMHCGDSPTAGCVAVPENVMKTIIEWLDENSVANIFITV